MTYHTVLVVNYCPFVPLSSIAYGLVNTGAKFKAFKTVTNGAIEAGTEHSVIAVAFESEADILTYTLATPCTELAKVVYSHATRTAGALASSVRVTLYGKADIVNYTVGNYSSEDIAKWFTLSDALNSRNAMSKLFKGDLDAYRVRDS